MQHGVFSVLVVQGEFAGHPGKAGIRSAQSDCVACQVCCQQMRCCAEKPQPVVVGRAPTHTHTHTKLRTRDNRLTDGAGAWILRRPVASSRLVPLRRTVAGPISSSPPDKTGGFFLRLTSTDRRAHGDQVNHFGSRLTRKSASQQSSRREHPVIRCVMIETTIEEAKSIIAKAHRQRFPSGSKKSIFDMPTLTPFGVLNHGIIKSRETKLTITHEQASKDLINAHLAEKDTDPFAERVAACVDVLRMVKSSSASRQNREDSYTLKHDVEEFFNAIGHYVYIPHSALIVAAYGMDLECSHKQGESGVYVAINKKNLEALRMLRAISFVSRGQDAFSRDLTGAEVILMHMVKRLCNAQKLIKDSAASATSPRQP